MPGRAATATLIGIPYDAASSFRRGAAAGPAAIREALASPAGNWFSESLVDLSSPGTLYDGGDVELRAGGERAAIESRIAEVLAAGSRPIALGGDHSVTHPIVRAVSAVHPSLTVVHIDAHPDLYDDFEGDRHSHACPFARIMEEGLAARLVQVAIRTMTRHQREQADRFGVEVIDMRAWARGVTPAVDPGETVYLSIDLDALDPAFAPGVSHPEPGGLAVRDVVSLVQALAGPIAGADVVECNPAADTGGITARVAAKLVKEIAARMVEQARAAGD
jgi:agmatinase